MYRCISRYFLGFVFGSTLWTVTPAQSKTKAAPNLLAAMLSSNFWTYTVERLHSCEAAFMSKRTRTYSGCETFVVRVGAAPADVNVSIVTCVGRGPKHVGNTGTSART